MEKRFQNVWWVKERFKQVWMALILRTREELNIYDSLKGRAGMDARVTTRSWCLRAEKGHLKVHSGRTQASGEIWYLDALGEGGALEGNGWSLK